MNPDQPSREQIEARLTALLLGELPAEEAELLRWTISQDAELQKLHNRLKLAIGLVRETIAHPAESSAEKTVPRKLSDERRQKLLAYFKTPRPKPPLLLKRFEIHPLVATLVAVAIIAMLAALALPSFTKARSTSQRFLGVSSLSGSAGSRSAELETSTVLKRRATAMVKSLPPAPVVAPPVAEGPAGGLGLPETGPSSTEGGVYSENVVGFTPVQNNSKALPTPPADSFFTGNAGVNNNLPRAGGGGGGGTTTANSTTLAWNTFGAGSANGKLPPEASDHGVLVGGLASPSEPAKGLAENGAENVPVLGDMPLSGGLTRGTSFEQRQAKTENRAANSAGAPMAAATPTHALPGSVVLDSTRRIPSAPAGGARKELSQPDTTTLTLSINNSFVGGVSDAMEPKPEVAKDKSRDANAVRARSITNAIALGDFQVEQKEIQALQAQVDNLRKGLAINDNDANSANPRSTLAEEQVGNYDAMRLEGEIRYKKLEQQLSQLKALNPDQLRNTLPTIISDPTLSDLVNKLHQAEKSQATKDELNRQIDARVAGIMDGLENQAKAEKAALDSLTTALEEAKAKDQTVAAQGQPYWEVKRKLDDRLNKESSVEAADQPLPKPLPTAPVPQPEILTHDNAFSTFSLNVSDVSFKLAAASLEKGRMPDAASIRSEEFINAFDYRDLEAAAGQPLAFTAERARYPFAHNRELLRFSVKTAAAGRQAGRALNLVLLLDTSGSMERADRVVIIREALRVLAAQLQPHDTVSVVTFARTARLWADGVPGDKAGETLGKVSGITPEGGTNLEEAMRLAYETARRHYLANGINRVVMLTDGAANLGNVDPNALTQKVEANRRQGIALDCFGIGWESYNDDLLEQLSSNGDGRYAFMNSPDEAAGEFAAKLAGALQVAAQDVKVQVEFNPQRVVSYRQIGYAKHQLTKEQFRDNSVAAGEIAAQEAGNALYTIETKPDGAGPIATVRVRYKVPGTTDYRERSWNVDYRGNAPALEQSSAAMRLAATASAFSEWLASSPFAEEVTPDQLLDYLSGVPAVYGADPRPKQLEWMIRQAKSLSGK